MNAKSLYLLLCVAGTVLPYFQLLPFLRDHGLDVLVSSVVLWAFVAIEGRRAGMKHLWAPVAANLAVGVSLGLPLFLYMRENCFLRRV